MISVSPVTTIAVTPRPFAAVRARLPVADVPRRFGEFLDQVYAARKAGQVALDGQNIFLYRPTESSGVVDAEFGVGVTSPVTPAGNVVLAAIPACEAATATLLGDYSGIRDAHQAVVDWCKANGRRRTGVRWEVYGHWTDDPSKVQTDVFHELAPSTHSG